MKLGLGCIVAAALVAAPAAAQTPPPVEAFGRLPAVADVSISPDGQRVAVAVNTRSGDGAIIIADLDDPDNLRQRYGVDREMQLRGVGWADTERVTYLVQQTVQPGQVLPPGFFFSGRPRRVDYYRHGAINLTSGHIQVLSTNLENPWADQGSDLISPIEGDPGFARLIGRTNNLERNNSQVFRVELNNGRVRSVAPRGVNRDTIGFVLDRAGAVVARLDSDDATNRWSLWVYDTEQPRLLAQDVSIYGEPLAIHGLLPDGRFAALENNEAGFSMLTAVSRTDGRRETLFARDNADVDGAIIDPWTREVVGVSWTDDDTSVHFFDPGLEAVQESLRSVFANRTFFISSWSQDRRRFVVYVESGLDGGAYYVYEIGRTELRSIGSRYPELVDTLRGERQALTYRARDGARVPAYLTFPGGVERTNMPLVVLVHGGPHSRDTMSFDYWSSFLASRGYAVLQPNFRGSSGYGTAWEDAGRRQWGGQMQTDVEDGVASLVRAGIVDPTRVCIVGASYGGYAALAGATLTPDRYTCAVAVAGVSDLTTMLSDAERQTGGADSRTSDWWRESIGDRRDDREHIRSISPALLADRVRIPILLIHGTDDTVVPIEQSRRMQRALTAAGKDVRFVELQGDDHWLSDAPTRIQMLRELETFLEQNLRAPAQ